MSSAGKKSAFAPLGQETLGSPSFLGLLMTQWLTIINDNTFRWLVVGIGKGYVSAEQHNLILTLGLALFVAPYLTLASHAGYLADRFSKRDVILACKVAEIFVMLLGIFAIYWGNIYLLFVVVALMGAQSALFAPSKMGQLPEMLPPNLISAANGWFALATFTATIIGMWIGGWLADATGPIGQDNLWASATVLIGIAIAGTLFSLLICRYPAADSSRRFPWKPHVETLRDLKTLASNRPLLLVVIGIVFFWAIGAISQLNIDQFAYESGTFYESERTPLLISLIFGVGIGSVLAGSLSRGRIELGILAYALLGLSLFSLLLATLNQPFFNTGKIWNWDLFLAMFWLLAMGASAGLFNVPLAAFVQHRSPPEQRGALLSATNFCVFSGIMVSAGLFSIMRLPVYDGAQYRVFANLDPHLTALQKSSAEDVSDAFEDQWNDATTERPSVEGYLADVPKDLHLYTLAHLAWVDVAERRNAGEKPNQLEYYDRFQDPLERQVIKSVFLQSGGLPLLSARHIFLLIGCVTLPVAIFTFRLLPQASIRFPLSIFMRWFGRVEVEDTGDFDDGKAAVLLVNRCSGFGRLMLHLTSHRKMLEIHWSDRPKPSWSRWWAEFWGAVWISSGPQSRQRGLATLRKHILRGGTVAVFPYDDARSTEPYPPLVFDLISGIKVPVLPIFVDSPAPVQAHEPRRRSQNTSWRQSLAIHIGQSRFVDTQDAAQLRRWMQEVGDQTMTPTEAAERKIPAIRFIESCRRRSGAQKIADSTGMSLKAGDLLMRTLIFQHMLRHRLLGDDEKYVAVLLPPSVPGAVANLALGLDRRVAVNLNYTVSEEILNSCIEQCGIKHVLTSRKVMDKLQVNLNAELIYLEDLRQQLTWKEKLYGFWNSKVTSTSALIRKLKLDQVDSSDELTIIFTSGSTGVPKGVMLTHDNIASNVEAIETVVRLDENDVLIGVLPFFHSFGFTVALWGVMQLDLAGVYHFNPLDAKRVGVLCKEHGGTVLLATPTFLRGYMKRCKPEEFKTLSVVVAGAEKLSTELSDEFEAKFGVRPAEGYGATELSPLVSVNVPESRRPNDGRLLAKEGTVGLPVPGVHAKVTHLDTGEELGRGESGMLWVTGPNVMKGYLHREDLTSEVVKDGWYNTGDVALVDDDGFIQITGRMSRFSKIGGEMVPHVKIEETLLAYLQDKVEDDGSYKVVVTAVPDAKKGERLVVLHIDLPVNADELRTSLQDAGLPPLFIPAQDSFYLVDEIPLLGTGKMDLKGMQVLAKQLATGA